MDFSGQQETRLEGNPFSTESTCTEGKKREVLTKLKTSKTLARQLEGNPLVQRVRVLREKNENVGPKAGSIWDFPMPTKSRACQVEAHWDICGRKEVYGAAVYIRCKLKCILDETATPVRPKLYVAPRLSKDQLRKWFRFELIDSQLLRDTLGLPPRVGRRNVKKTVPKWRGARNARAHSETFWIQVTRCYTYVYCTYEFKLLEGLSGEFETVSCE